MLSNPFQELGLNKNPVILAPLAGVSDHPFRRVCQGLGADLTYVEMISATALCYNSPKTIDMLVRHPDEPILGVQVTSRNAEEMGRAAEFLDSYSFETLDINMGCPVKKVVKSGCGSAILKDPERVYQTTLAAVKNFSRPVSVKIRLGWDHSSVNWKEVAEAAQSAGARWLTVHGRTRSDSYGDPVNLEAIAQLKQSVQIPVIGNGNLFSASDAKFFYEKTNVDGLMVSRGALGNPWVFRDIKNGVKPVNADEWIRVITDHVTWQKEAYGDTGVGSVCMRKHVLWYVSGWPDARKIREKINTVDSLDGVRALLAEYFEHLKSCDFTHRFENINLSQSGERFLWDPKFDMDRKLDRGVGDDCLVQD